MAYLSATNFVIITSIIAMVIKESITLSIQIEIVKTYIVIHKSHNTHYI